MPGFAHAIFGLVTLGAIRATFAATSLVPLASKSFPYTALPTQAAGDDVGPRGRQQGFNNCSLASAGPNSLCQTMVLNSATDFCLWGSPTPNETVGGTEALEVAYCTNPDRGGRPISAGTFTGVQWLYAPNYIQYVLYLDQTALGFQASDLGGELDPHGDDEQGNPLGGLVYTNAMTHMDNSTTFNQRLMSGTLFTSDNEELIREWVYFIGGGRICAKACRNSDPNGAALCQHIYDEIGCDYNAVADYAAINNTFTVCDSTDMDPPGIYTSDGQLQTFHQPFSGTFSIPYTPTPVTSSNCFTYQSSQLFPELSATPVAGSNGADATATGAPGSNGSNGSGPNASRSGAAGGPAPTSGANAAAAVVAGPVAILVSAMLGAFVTMFA